MEVTIDQCWEMNLTSTLQRKPTTYQCMTTNIENQSTRQHKTEFQWTGMSLRDENNTDNQSTHEMNTDTSQSICFVSRDHNPHHGHHQRSIPCTVTLHSQWRCSAGSSRGFSVQLMVQPEERTRCKCPGCWVSDSLLQVEQVLVLAVLLNVVVVDICPNIWLPPW